ncbi:MAG: hypothetical protein RSF67_06505 [Clostridia bacterium]
MSKYVDVKYHCYNSISACLKYKSNSIFVLSEMLYRKTKLLIVNKTSEDIIMTINDIQPLYLYPLSILDYCKSLLDQKIKIPLTMIKISIIDFDKKNNYIDKLRKLNLKYLSNVEIEISEKYNDSLLNEMIEFLNYLTIKNIKITLLFKTIDVADELLIKFCSICEFFKIIMPNILNTPLFDEFAHKLEIICSNKKDISVVLIKSYLDVEQSAYYEKAINIFDQLNINIFQLSKELMPINIIDNPQVSQDIQDNIRLLEGKYCNAQRTKFISVKDISTLYYPRFELDERNSRKCYACVMKPYLLKDKFLPCRVQRVIDNIDDWYVSNLDNFINKTNISKCGMGCDDCASMFENDILNEIDTIIQRHKRENIEFILEVE